MAEKKTSAKAKVPASNSETKLVRELANILNETDLSEIELKRGDLKIRVSKQNGQVISAVAAPAVGAPSPAAPQTAQAMPPITPAAPTEDANHPGAVKSPMVGTAYIRPSPDAAPFAAEGKNVSEGDTILLVEAMKTFNPITAPKSGIIKSILVNDAQPVEFGEPLFIIE